MIAAMASFSKLRRASIVNSSHFLGRRRDAQEVDRLGDVLDFLLGHGPTPTKRALTLAHTSARLEPGSCRSIPAQHLIILAVNRAGQSEHFRISVPSRGLKPARRQVRHARDARGGIVPWRTNSVGLLTLITLARDCPGSAPTPWPGTSINTDSYCGLLTKVV